MNINLILDFLSKLKLNNNREWFSVNKSEYETAKNEFEKICKQLIIEIGKFDKDILHIDASECIFRIYRDTRFSKDKTPYKTHFGAFIAAGGGRKSKRAGYYFHLDPDGCFVASGIWCPPPDLLKALRRSVYDNIEELNEIRASEDFLRFYDKFYDDEKLKTVPAGYPKDFKDAELLKLKHYMVEHKIDNTVLHSDDVVLKIAEIMKSAYPLMLFLNYTADEVL